jgi:hypothetical protein
MEMENADSFVQPRHGSDFLDGLPVLACVCVRSAELRPLAQNAYCFVPFPQIVEAIRNRRMITVRELNLQRILYFSVSSIS